LAISYSFCSVRHVRTLLTEISQCGVEPPKVLTELVSAFDELEHVSAVSDPIAGLVKAIVSGQLRGKELDAAVDDADDALRHRDFRAGLAARVEPALVRECITALDAGGAADVVIDSLRPQFDVAAAKLVECAELVDPGTDPETFLASATAEQIRAWQEIDEHVATLTKISSVVAHFGPHSTSFPLSEMPANISAHMGFVNNNGVMCVSPEWGLERGCQLFLNHGSHRNSPWFRGAAVLKLNTIAETREKIRAWAEVAWDAMNINQGRGRFEDGEFVPEPVSNPFAIRETVS